MFTHEDVLFAYEALTKEQTAYLANGGHFNDPEYIKRDVSRMRFYDALTKDARYCGHDLCAQRRVCVYT